MVSSVTTQQFLQKFLNFLSATLNFMWKKSSWGGNYTYHLFGELILFKDCVEMLSLTELTLKKD
jgi:hypothetical protein